MSPASNLAAIFISAAILAVALYAVFLADRKENRAADKRHAEWRRYHQAHVQPRWKRDETASARRLPPEPTPMRWTRRVRGQAFVEFALVVPIALFMLLGAIEAGLLVTSRFEQQRDVGEVADYAAAHPDNSSWEAVANQLLPGCEVEDETNPGDKVVTFRATCEYNPLVTRGLWDGLQVSTEASATTDDSPTSAPAPAP